MTTQLFPRQPRRMKQPRKDAIRYRAELAEAQLAFQRTPLWWRLWRRIWARLVEVDPTARQNNRPPFRNPPPATEPLSGLDP